jgi:hypothetical protein
MKLNITVKNLSTPSTIYVEELNVSVEYSTEEMIEMLRQYPNLIAQLIKLVEAAKP